MAFKWDKFLLRIVYPVILAVAGITRLFNVVSCLYYGSFIVISLWNAIPKLKTKKVFGDIHVTCLLIISLATILCESIFSILYALDDKYEWSFQNWYNTCSHNACGTIGVRRIDEDFNGLRYFLSDLLVFAFTLVLFIRYRTSNNLYITSSRKPKENRRVATLATSLSYFVLLFVLGVSFPSLINIIYLGLFISATVLIRDVSLVDHCHKLWKLVLGYNLCHLVMLYVAQAPQVYSGLSDIGASSLGILHYKSLKWEDYPLLVNYGTAILLFRLMCQWYKLYDAFYERDSSRPRASAFLDEEKQHLISRRPRKSHVFWHQHGSLRLLVLFTMRHGWKLCLVGFFFAYFMSPSIVVIGILFLLCIGLVMPRKYDQLATRIAITYLVLVITVQYIYNIDFSWESGNIGLSHFNTAWPFMGAYVLLLSLLSFFYMVGFYADMIESVKTRSKNNPNMGQLQKAFSFSTSTKSIFHRAANSKLVKLIAGFVKSLVMLLLQQSYFVSLCALYFSGLRAINVLNAGYMVFFITFMTASQSVTEALWGYLVFYADMVVIFISIWQIAWTKDVEGTTTHIIGLEHHNPLWQGIIWNLVIMIFSAIQYHLIQLKLDPSLTTISTLWSAFLFGEKSPESRAAGKRENLLNGRFVQKLAATFYQYSHFFSYTFIVTITLFDTLSCLTILFLVFIFICLLIHMVLSFENSFKVVKGIWPIFTFITGLTLIARYIYQFEEAESFFKDIIDSAGILNLVTMKELGLEHYEISQLFTKLMGNTGVLVICVFQARVFLGSSRVQTPDIEKQSLLDHAEGVETNSDSDEKDSDKETSDAPIPEAAPIPDAPLVKKRRGLSYLSLLWYSFKSLLWLHSNKLTLTVIWLTIILDRSLLNTVYLVLLIVSIFFSGEVDALGLIFLVYSQLLVLAKLVFHFDKFQQYRDDDKDMVEWVGFTTHDHTLPWTIVGENVAIIFCVVLHRFIQKKKYPNVVFYPSARATHSKKYSVMVVSEYVQIIEDNHENRRRTDSTVTNYSNTEVIVNRRSTTVKINDKLGTLSIVKWYLQNMFSLYGFEIFCLFVLFSLNFRVNFEGILFCLFLGLCKVLPIRRFYGIGALIFDVVMILLLLAQYLLILGKPPSLHQQPAWHTISGPYQRWLCLDTQWPFALTVDFVVLYLGVLLYRQDSHTRHQFDTIRKAMDIFHYRKFKRILLEHHIPSDTDIIADKNQPDQSEDINVVNSDNTLIDATSEEQQSAQDSNNNNNNNNAPNADNKAESPQLESRTSLTVILLLGFLRYSGEAILVLTFVAGSFHVDFFSFGYVLFSLYLLYVSLIEVDQRYEIETKPMEDFETVQVPASNRRYSSQTSTFDEFYATEDSSRSLSQGPIKRKEQYLEHRADTWFILRLYNFIVVLAQMIYQCPLFPESTDADSVQQIFGFKKMHANLDTLSHSIVWDLLIMALLAMQAKIFERRELKVICALIAKEQQNAFKKAQEYFTNLKQQYEHAKKMQTAEMKARWLRLIHVKMKIDPQSKSMAFLQSSMDRYQTAPLTLKTPPRASPLPSSPRVDVAEIPLTEVEEATPTSSPEPSTPSTPTTDSQPPSDIELEFDARKIERRLTQQELELDDEEPQALKSPAVEEEEEEIETTVYRAVSSVLYKILSAINSVVDHVTVYMERSIKYKPQEAAEAKALSRWSRLFVAVLTVAEQQSKYVCFGFFVLDHIAYANILSLVFVLATFGYGLLREDPKPSKKYWNVMLLYTNLVILLKFVFEMPFLCDCDGSNHPTYSFQTSSCDICSAFGVGNRSSIFFFSVLLDILVLLALLYHRHVMKKNGLWDTVIKEKELLTEFDWKEKKKNQFMARNTDSSDTKSVRIDTPVDTPRSDVEQLFDEDDDWDPVLADSVPTGFVYTAADTLEQFLHFFKSATDSGSKLGFDLYNAIFLTDFICFVFLVFFQGEFTGVQMSNVVEFFEQSRIPILYLTVIIMQFILIIVNRIIYLYRSLRSKLILLYMEILFYNFFLCFYIPRINDVPFGDSPALVIFYILKCVYLTFSALQVCHGYPVFTKDKFLTKAVSDWREIAFMIYRAIPFAFELTTLLDFIVIDTTLTFREFLKLEDLYSELFLVKCTIETNKKSGRKIGEKQPKFVKCTQGILLFTSLVCLIWLPLLVLSSGNPANVPNLINEGTIYIGVQGWEPFFVQNQNEFIKKINKHQYDSANSITDPTSNIQVTLFDQDSEQLWLPTQPTETGLIAELQSNTTVSYLSIELLFTRDHPSDHLTIYNTYNVRLTEEQQTGLSQVIDDQSATTSVVVNNALPRFCELPLEGNIDFLTSDGMIDLNLTLNYAYVNISNGDGISGMVLQRWWTISQIVDNVWTDQGIQVATVSEDTAVGFAATIASTGLVGLYVGVVLSVGRFLRMWVSDLISRIYLDNMDSVDQLLAMIQDVFIARQYNDLLLEEYLYNELILLFRDPRKLLELTKKKE